MKPEDARDILSDMRDQHLQFVDGAELAYENCNIIVCPTCGGRLKLKSKGKYCDKCGQKLDWER